MWAEVINVRGESMKRTVAALRAGGYDKTAASLELVSRDSGRWETYNRETFLAHAAVYQDQPGKLRFLTYVTEKTRGWWEQWQDRGAVIL